jgi:sedoheptulokinase
LGYESPHEEWFYSRLNELGLRYGQAKTGLEVEPCFYGERHNPNRRGVIRGIQEKNFDLGHLAAGLAKGIIQNLKDMLPTSLLENRQRMMGSGNALRQNRLLREMAEEVFQLPLVMHNQPEESACGAAILAGALLANN